MNKIVSLILVLTYCQLSYSCSIFCGITAQFDTSVYMLEGEVIDYTGNFTHENMFGEFASLKVKVSRILYAPEKVDVVNVIDFGLTSDCLDTGKTLEELKKDYPIGTIVTFVAKKSNLLENGSLNLEVHICHSIFDEGVSNRIPYDYEKERKIRVEIYKKRKKLDNYPIDQNYNALKAAVNNEYDLWLEREKTLIPPMFQVYLDLLEIHKTSSKKKKFRIIRRLIWSLHANSSFIEQQNISKKMKKKLLLEFEDITTNWVPY